MGPVRILHVVPNMQAGGLETFIMNIYRHLNREKIQFDFLVHYAKHCFYDDEIERLGGNIYRMTVREDRNLLKYWNDLNRFFKEHKEYTIVHGHMTSIGLFYFTAAKMQGVVIRICHSHSTSAEKTMKGFVKRILEKTSEKCADIRLACSDSAGKYLYGGKSYIVIPNAIDTQKFRLNEERRRQVREQLKVTDKLVIGHVGRFDNEKNHDFLLNIFFEIKKRVPDSVLILIGTGKLVQKIEEKANDLDLRDSVLFLGTCGDVYDMYQAMDVFVLPSLFEGLPIVTVEAQCSGLAVVASDTVSNEAKITDHYYSVSLKNGADYWAEKVIAAGAHTRKDMSEEIKKAGYDIKDTAEAMSEFYLSRNKQLEEL